MMQKNPVNVGEPKRLLLPSRALLQYWPIWLLLSSLLIPACTYDTLEVTPECEEDIQLEVVEVQASACDQAIGLIEVKSTNTDDPTLVFSIDGTTFQADGRFEDLDAGTYILIARTDLCETTTTVQVENAAGLNATLTTAASACDQATGAINVSVSDAIGEVQYKLDGGSPQTNASFSNLTPGSYTLIVSDESGCEVSLEATIASTISYGDIESIVNSSCAVSSCHAGNVSPDFRVKDNVLNNASLIKTRTGNQSMPPVSSSNSLTPSQIEAIACWVDDGAQG